ADPQFFTIDPSNGTIINNLPGLPLVDIEGLAYGNNLVYALEKRDNARLFSFDGTSWSTIGTTGVNFANAGLAYDSDLDLLYAKGSQNTALYSIDVMTGVATNIGDTGLSEGGGLAFVASEPTPPPTPSVPEPSAMLGLMILGGFGFVSGLKKDG
ncbi:MAG: PEP-CTERM sorting domain-containing protein, partial [Microcystaceae cyanobacterium]